MEPKFFVLIFLQCFLVGSIKTDSSGGRDKDASILLLGMSGAGIFSTADMLMNGNIQKTSNASPLVTEYSWKVPLSNNTNNEAKIRIATSPGLVNGKTPEQDARTLETLKEYFQSPSGLNKTYPSIVIVVSRFDDSRASGSNSNFVRMLKSVELISDYLGPDNLSSNIIFHLTYLMSRTRAEARRPNTTIDHFKGIIRGFTTFSEPISVTIGENLPDEYGLPRNGAYTQLPNKQLYPKNLIDEMKTLLWARGDIHGRNIIDKAFRDPYNRPNPSVKTFTTDDTKQESQKEFTKSLTSSNFDIDEGTDINQALQTAYDNLDEELKKSHPAILQLVQVAFQRLNITSRDQLPKSTVKTVELFQKIPFHMASLALVQDAFKLGQPEFIFPPVVGQGYDILKDETVTKSPFVINNFQPTSIGYSLPNILICRMENENAVEKFKLIQSYDHYKENRLQDLNVQEPVNSTVFIGTVRSGYNNIRPDADAFVALTAVQETRNFKLDLIESSDLNDEFQDDVYNLSPFNQSDRESPKEWKSFFNKYGTHVVSEAYGGGYMEGKASGEAIRNNLRYNTVLHGIKDNLLSFRSLPSGVNSRNIDISHSFFGGSPDPKLADVHRLPSRDRESLLRQWKDSLRSDPRILEFNLKLTPISTISRLVNDDKGHEVQIALDHLLKGTLVYIRPKSPTKPPNLRLSSTTARNPYIYSRRTTTIPTTTAASEFCEPFDCPDVSTCLECPEVPTCPTCQACSNSEPQKLPKKDCSPADTTEFENILGLSYHIVKDDFLTSSPYIIRMKNQSGIFVPEGFNVTRKEHPCILSRFERLKSHEEYTAYRINKFNISRQPFTQQDLKEIRNHDGVAKLRAGYNIMARKDSVQQEIFHIYQEMRYFDVKLNSSEIQFAPQFVRDVENLPLYRTNKQDCMLMEQWLDFFDKYGTHVVTGGYAGVFQENDLSGASLSQLQITITSSQRGYKVDEGCRRLEPYERFDDEDSAISTETAQLTKLKDIISHFGNSLSTEYDLAVRDLILGRIKYCY